MHNLAINIIEEKFMEIFYNGTQVIFNHIFSIKFFVQRAKFANKTMNVSIPRDFLILLSWVMNYLFF
jgi:hypothetical protein